MAGITIGDIGTKLSTLLDEVRGMRFETCAMRAEIASFRIVRDTDTSSGTSASDAELNGAENACEVQ